MRKYLFLIRTSLLELIEYRANIPARSFAFVLNLSLTLLLWLAVTGGKNQIFGYSPNEILVYYLFMSGVLPLVIGGGDVAGKIGGDIKSGDLGGVILKPIKPLYYYGTISLAERLKDFAIIFPLVFLVSNLAQVSFPFNTDLIPLIILSLVFTFILNHLFMGIVGLMAFWTTEISWGNAFISQVITLFSGVRFPTNFYPAIISSIVSFTPFLYFGFFPASLVLRKDIINLNIAFLVQFFWIVTLAWVLRSLWRKGIIRYEGASQ